MRLLLLSNSTSFGEGYLDHAMAEVRDFLGAARRVAFVPFALADHAAYTAKARARLEAEGFSVTAVPASAGGSDPLAGAEAVFIGGGNTFRLLRALHAGG